jgi:hypothetical protein
MTRKWGAVLGFVLLFGACRKATVPQGGSVLTRPQPGLQKQTQATTLDEALRVQPQTSDGSIRAEQPPKTARADETIQMENANGVAYQRRTAVKRSDARRRHRHSSARASATHEEIGVRAAVPGVITHTTLQFQNDAGSMFRLVDARFVMDGAELPTVMKAADLGKNYVIFSGDVSSGHHAVTVQLTYQGASHGVFSYMNGYTFKVKSDEVLTIHGDRAVSFTIICKERPGFNEIVEKRLVVTVEGRRAA